MSSKVRKVCLASDNWSPAHPLVMKAIEEANDDFAPSYGGDRWTEEAQSVIQKAFKRSCKVFVVPCGTGANIFGLSLGLRRSESVICTDIAHINYQESGASEALLGCKLITIPHENGKVVPELLIAKIRRERAFGMHSTNPRILSITQPTEIGTVYTPEELITLSKICKEEKLLLHVDGSRFYNAAVSLQLPLADMVHGVDMLSLGGTKNGLMGAESLVIFHPDLQEGSGHLHKQNLQFMSKMRYLSAQYIAFFKNDLWHALAREANQRAKEIATLVKSTPSLSLSYPVETNQIFFTAPPAWIPKIQERVACHLWDSSKQELRWIASWNTSEEDVGSLRMIIQEMMR